MVRQHSGSLPEDMRETILRVARSHGATRAAVFGSFARNGATSGSDLDILVDLEHGTSLLDLVAIKQDLEDEFGFSVDVVTEQALSPYIREDVLKSLVAL